MDCWRIYHSDVDLRNAREPLDALKSLVDVYGFDIRIGEKTGSFFWREWVPIDPKTPRNIIGFPTKPGFDYSVSWVPGMTANGQIQIVVAFGINHTKYEEALRQHGIRIKRNEDPRRH